MNLGMMSRLRAHTPTLLRGCWNWAEKNEWRCACERYYDERFSCHSCVICCVMLLNNHWRPFVL